MKIEEVFQKLKPIGGPGIDRLWIEYVLADSKTQKTMEDALRVMLAEALEEGFEGKQILLPPPPRERAEGDYPIGSVFYGENPMGYSFSLRKDEMVRHLALYGISGAGKSLTAMNLALRVMDGIPILILDWKRNWRDLLSICDKEILVFSIGGKIPFFFNPLIPPDGTPPNTWMKKLVEVMGHAYYLGFGVFDIMEEAIDRLYTDYGIYSGKTHSYPTMRDVYGYLKDVKLKGRRADWMDSTMRAIRKLCFGDVARTFNYRKPFPLEELLRRNVILELDSLTDADKVFLIEALLLWIHRYRLAEQGEREALKHVIVLEEAHHALSKQKTLATGTESITDVIFREIREYGESLWVIDQEPALVSIPAMNNTYCTIGMNMKHQKNLEALGAAMLMDTRQRKYLGRLETGWGIVKLQGRWPEPFLVKFPHVGIRKGEITDQILHERLERLMKRDQRLFRVQESEIEPDEAGGDVLRVFRGSGKEPMAKAKTLQGLEGLAGSEISLLRDIAGNRFSGISERYLRLGLNAYQGNKAKAGLLERDMARERDIATPTGRIRLLELTDRGKNALGMKESSKGHRKGGFEHEFWRARLAMAFKKQGFEVREEVAIGQGKTVDLVGEKNGERLALEIETGKSEAVYNIRKDIEAGFDGVISVSLSQEVRRKIENQLRIAGLEAEKRVAVVTPASISKGHSLQSLLASFIKPDLKTGS